jgi:hypothetical protein
LQSIIRKAATQTAQTAIQVADESESQAESEGDATQSETDATVSDDSSVEFLEDADASVGPMTMSEFYAASAAAAAASEAFDEAAEVPTEAPVMAEVPAEAAQSEPVAQSGARRSYCNSTLGLVEVGVQKAARLATCRHCLSKINRNSVRIAYAYSLTKFHAWVHAECTAALLRAEGANLKQAVAFLSAWQRQAETGCQDPLTAAKVAEVLRALQDM